MAADVLSWWIGLALFGLAFSAVAERIFPASFVDRGQAFAKPLAIVAFTYASWLLTSAGLRHGIALGTGLLVIAALGLWARHGLNPDARLRRWALDEAIFVAVFLMFALLRALQPEIVGAEKYMDFALFNTLRRAEHFPPQDPWLAGAGINYYYFGYLLFADLARLTRIDGGVAYNLSLASIGAMVAVGALRLGERLSGATWGGVLAAIATVGIGNLDGARQLLLERRPWTTFDYWRSTRVVPNTINEFPFFSVLHGDLHPHVTALIINVTLIGVALAVCERSANGEARVRLRASVAGLAAIGLLLGALALTNPWDVPVYFTLLAVLALHCRWDARRPLHSVVSVAVALVASAAVMILLSLPFTLRFRAQFRGIGWVHERTTLVPFLTVFGFLMLPPLAWLVRQRVEALRNDPPRRDLVFACTALSAVVLYVATQSAALIFAVAAALGALPVLLCGPAGRGRIAESVALATVGAVAIGAGEIVFLRDPYGADLHRMNTIFKLYLQAWVLLALALPGLASDLFARWRSSGARAAGVACLLIGLTLSLCYPMAVIRGRWAGARTPLSLDGLAYLDREHPADAAAIRWLEHEVRDSPVVLEATGDPYTYYGRVSSNTGLPTVLGWGNHEGVWRGGDPRIRERLHDVALVYGESDLDVVRRLLARYGIRYVFVGELERERYSAAGLDKFAAHPELFEPVYRSGTTAVFAVRETIASE